MHRSSDVRLSAILGSARADAFKMEDMLAAVSLIIGVLGQQREHRVDIVYINMDRGAMGSGQSLSQMWMHMGVLTLFGLILLGVGSVILRPGDAEVG